MVLKNGIASIASIANQISSGSMTGIITSTTAASDSTHLTAVGVEYGLISFENLSVSSTDVLLKYTYFGDANLDGKVDGSDYSLIDSGFIQRATGWFNGDFNYDGVINGSDYTLIDNAFDRQAGQITAQLAAHTDAIYEALPSSSPVPEPANLEWVLTTLAGTLSCRRKKTQSSRGYHL